MIEIVDEQGLQRLDTLLEQRLEQLGGDDGIGLRDHLTGLGIDLTMCEHASNQELGRNLETLDTRLL